MALAPPMGDVSVRARVSKRFQLEPNSLGVQIASFQFRDHSCVFALESENGKSPIECTADKWVDGVTDMPGTPPRFLTVSDPRPVKVASSGVWKDGTTFQMQWRFYETPHYVTVTCRFEGDSVRIEIMDDVTKASNGTMLLLLGHALT
jgi:hypothetical protein